MSLDQNRLIVDTLLEVAIEKKPVALELLWRARSSSCLSERQRQILPELVDHSFCALDLLVTGWKSRQALWVGSGSRSLFEARLVAAYVTKSEENAQRYFDDGLIDIRDVFDSLKSQSEKLGDVGDFSSLINQLTLEMSQLLSASGLQAKAKYLSTLDMARAVGAEEDYKLFYQFLSKFSHSSSVAVLTRNGDLWISIILPILAMAGFNGYLMMLAVIAEACAEK